MDSSSEGLDGLKQKVDIHTVRLAEEIAYLRKETPDLDNKMAGLNQIDGQHMEQTVAKHSTELMNLRERMDKMETREGIHTTAKGDRQTRNHGSTHDRNT